MNTTAQSDSTRLPSASSVEKARVVSVQRCVTDSTCIVWVEAFQRSTCGECVARDGCGQGVLGRWFARKQRHYSVRCDMREAELLTVGQWVEVAIPEGALARVAMLAYLLPLAGLLAGAIVGAMLALADWLVALGSALGFYAGFKLAQHAAGRSSWRHAAEPVLLGLASA